MFHNCLGGYKPHKTHENLIFSPTLSKQLHASHGNTVLSAVFFLDSKLSTLEFPKAVAKLLGKYKVKKSHIFHNLNAFIVDARCNTIKTMLLDEEIKQALHNKEDEEPVS